MKFSTADVKLLKIQRMPSLHVRWVDSVLSTLQAQVRLALAKAEALVAKGLPEAMADLAAGVKDAWLEYSCAWNAARLNVFLRETTMPQPVTF